MKLEKLKYIKINNFNAEKLIQIFENLENKSIGNYIEDKFNSFDDVKKQELQDFVNQIFKKNYLSKLNGLGYYIYFYPNFYMIRISSEELPKTNDVIGAIEYHTYNQIELINSYLNTTTTLYDLEKETIEEFLNYKEKKFLKIKVLFKK